MGSSSIRQWSTWVSCMLVEWQWLQVVCFGGVIMVLGVFGFCLVWPLCPLGRPGYRLVFFGFSGVVSLVLYSCRDGGVWGFSYLWRARVSLSISVFCFLLLAV